MGVADVSTDAHTAAHGAVLAPPPLGRGPQQDRRHAQARHARDAELGAELSPENEGGGVQPRVHFLRHDATDHRGQVSQEVQPAPVRTPLRSVSYRI